MTTPAAGRLSSSTRLALDWAWAAARHRSDSHAGSEGSRAPNGTSELTIGPADLLVGTLLAHPRDEGEGRVLLQHFGLTARDVLPTSYPKLSIQDLRRQAAGVDPGHPHPLDSEAESVLASAESLAGGQVHLRYLLGALLAVEDRLRWRTSLAARGAEAVAVRDSYVHWLQEEREARTEVAGRRLRQRLERENPRRPIDLPQYSPDRIDSQQDHIGIATETDAFARLIASCDLTPPLAIALFGDWGSGKSFLMRAVQDRLEALTTRVASQPQRELRVWKRIKQIEFNAWEYVQGNLWASLLENIFTQLGSMKLQLVESWRAPVEEQLAVAKGEVQGGKTKVEDAKAEVSKLEEKVKQAQQAAETAAQEAEDAAKDERRRQAEDHAREALKRFWGQVPEALAGPQSGAELVAAVRQARAELEQGRALAAYWKDWRHIVIVSIGVLAAPVIAVLLTLGTQLAREWTVFGGLVSLVPVLTATLRAASRWSGAVAKELHSAEVAVQERLDAPVADAQRALDETREEAAKARANLARAEEELRLSELRSTDLNNELKSLTPGRILVNFADRRSTEYARRLGLLGQVRNDLEDLEGSILENNRRLLAGEALPAEAAADDVPNRIVLYIDDLDRCPPAKVVEVLEAVHLLLAFELFVVVVAVDSRWLASALINRLVALQARAAEPDQPTTNDYLEKIFQLPFWVQPLGADGRKSLVHGLLRGSIREPHHDVTPDAGNMSRGLRVSPAQEKLVEQMLLTFGTDIWPDTSPLLLEPADLALFESLAPLLGDTPRRVKRFVNICQLLYAMSPPLTSGEGVNSERARVALLVAVCDGSAAIGGRLLDGIEATRPQPGESVAASHAKPVTLSGFVDTVESTCDRQEWERLITWLSQHPDWGAVPLSRFDERLDMIRRLRFEKPDVA